MAALPNDPACANEFEASVTQLFYATVSAYSYTLTNQPPTFTSASQDAAAVKRTIDAALTQLAAQRNAWCSTKTTAHPYLTALPRLQREFTDALTAAIEDRRSQLQAQYQRSQAEAAATKRAAEESARQDAERRAAADKAQRDKEQVADAQREAREKGAATRNAAKIKALGLPSAFVNSTLYLNDMGNWTPFMPCAQWLGLLLENKEIALVQAISIRGYPGISVKRAGQPAGGVVFRMEGNEAYLYGIVADGKAEAIQSPAEHTLIGLSLKALAHGDATR